MRRQNISNAIKNLSFDGNIVVQSRDYKGHFLLGDERCNGFDLIMSNDDVGAIIFRASQIKSLPKNIPINTFLANQSQSRQGPIFPREILFKINRLRRDLLPTDLKALFFIRYWYADDDPTGATIGTIEVIVMDADCKNKFCTVCDLREYASQIVVDGSYPKFDQELPIAFRTPDSDVGENQIDEDLPIKKRNDSDLN
jgi:hypothetical protein